MPRDGFEIGGAAKPGRRKRANAAVPTTQMLPASEPIPSDGGDDGHLVNANHGTFAIVADFGEGAIKSLSTEAGVPPPPIETGATHLLAPKLAVPPSPTISALVELQKQRQFCIKSQSRCDRSCEAFIARYLGYRGDLTERERKELFKRAGTMRRAVEKGGLTISDNRCEVAPEAGGEGRRRGDNQHLRAPSACIPIILNSATARMAWDSLRAQTEKQMRKLAASLPVYAWASSVKGFGDLGLAIIIGETGDLANYATKERVWKRIGLAVIEGERQQRRTNAEQAAAHGYNPKRRAEIWTIGDSMFKHQWHGAKDDLQAGPSGPYGEVYARRKAHTETREGWTLAHRDADARRIMMKALVENLWRVWNGKEAL